MISSCCINKAPICSCARNLTDHIYMEFSKCSSIISINERLFVKDIPEILNAKEGFHQDLNANESVELWAPTLPCKYWKCYIRNSILIKLFRLLRKAYTFYLQQEVLIGLPRCSHLQWRIFEIVWCLGIINPSIQEKKIKLCFHANRQTLALPFFCLKDVHYLVCNSKPKSM